MLGRSSDLIRVLTCLSVLSSPGEDRCTLSPICVLWDVNSVCYRGIFEMISPVGLNLCVCVGDGGGGVVLGVGGGGGGGFGVIMCGVPVLT